MDQSPGPMAQQIARAASAFERQRAGHLPKSVNVVLSEDTLVITLHGVLSPAEKTLARIPAGAAQTQQFYRQLFATSSGGLWQEITRITGVGVREATAEADTATGAMMQMSASGTMVQAFLLTRAGRVQRKGLQP